MAYRDDSFYIEKVIRHKDGAAFADLINKYKTLAFGVAFRVTGNREDAEEVAQDAFVNVYHSLQEFEGRSKFSTWLFRIVYNLALNKIRKKSLFTGSTDDELFTEQPGEQHFDAVQSLEEKDRKRCLNKAISLLEPQDQLLINLYYINDLPISEINEITDLSISNIKVRIFRARKKLHVCLETILKDELYAIL